MQVYFRIFTGTKYVSTVSLRIGRHERFAVLTLATIILMGGLFPQHSISSRYRAAHELLDHREGLSSEKPSEHEPPEIESDAHHTHPDKSATNQEP